MAKLFKSFESFFVAFLDSPPPLFFTSITRIQRVTSNISFITAHLQNPKNTF
ncbi:hypothetical protein [Helicobacter trogontum]|uniref:hypothetical protein n=1 Tax=Helicobacter trogontum TaxID=50960 RepID=UPI001386B91C|nr:hypothetical protein [Helicobacter trogontum]